jgi:hypothetical protein
MRKVVLTYGLIAGLIVSLLIVVTWSIMPPESDYAMSMLLGYAGMLISLSMIFFAIKSYRDNYLGGAITWGKGFMVGLYVSIIASVLYVIGWKIFSAIAMPDFWDQYGKHMVDSMKKQGASDAAILEATKQAESYKHMNPIMEWGMTFLEIFPVGLLISAICALILRRKASHVIPATS